MQNSPRASRKPGPSPSDHAAQVPRCFKSPDVQSAVLAEPINSFRYDAFISYRHVEPDRAWAKRLRHALETYRAPKRAGMTTHFEGEQITGVAFCPGPLRV